MLAQGLMLQVIQFLGTEMRCGDRKDIRSLVPDQRPDLVNGETPPGWRSVVAGFSSPAVIKTANDQLIAGFAASNLSRRRSW